MPTPPAPQPLPPDDASPADAKAWPPRESRTEEMHRERANELAGRARELRERMARAQEHARRAVGAARDRRLVQDQGGPGVAARGRADADSGAAGPVVLLVDDEPIVRAVLARCLSLGGYRVLEASGGEEALALLAVTADVALVVTDTWMPDGMSGVELIRRIRAQRPAQPLLRISGVHESHFYADPPPSDVPYLAKPFAPDALLRVVAELVQTAPPS